MTHTNSLKAYSDITDCGAKEKRRQSIVNLFKDTNNKPLRDVDVLSALFPGREDMNLVRPRLSELHRDRILKEGPTMKSPSGRQNVRTSLLVNFNIQMELGL
jgi:hypothetical protein